MAHSKLRPQDDDQPPAYAPGPSAPASAAPAPPPSPRLNHNHAPNLSGIDFAKYALQASQLSKDQTTRTTYSSTLYSNAENLERLVQEQLALPPIPLIHIVGRQHERYESDFDIKLNMLPFILHREDRPWNYVKVLEKGEKGYRGTSAESTSPNVMGGMAGWLRRFCDDRSAHKSFTIRRLITAWDTELLEGRLRTLIAGTGFKGNVTITFPVTQSTLVIHSPNPPSAFNNVLSLIVNGKKAEVKRYETVTAIWPYAVRSPTANDEERNPKMYAVQSEDAWFRDWKHAIRYAVLEKRKGWATEEDRMEVALDPTKVAKTWSDYDHGIDERNR